MIFKVLLYSFLFYVCGAKQNISEECASKLSCHECIEMTGCAWCSQEEMFDGPRCFHPNFNLPYISEICSEEYVYFAVSSIEVDETIPTERKQILPIKYDLSIRIGEPIYLSISINKTDDDLNNLSPLEVHHNASKFLKVDFTCLSDALKPIANCDVIKGKQYVNIKIEALKCPTDSKEWNQNFIVYSTDENDFVQIQLDLLCSCPCEEPGSIGYEPKSLRCNAVGTLKCGACDCDLIHSGKYCECIISPIPTVGCTQQTDALECSGRGTCICDRCDCQINANPENKIYGNYCECDNFSCYVHNGKMCSGIGKCDCGKCLCPRDWVGVACECLQSLDSCYTPFEPHSICSNHGDCVCGECKCHNVNGISYRGKYCENYPGDNCNDLQPCVLCQAYKRGNYSESDCLTKCHNVTIIHNTEENEEGEVSCEGDIENNCKYKFIYKFTNDQIQVKTALWC